MNDSGRYDDCHGDEPDKIKEANEAWEQCKNERT